jgi:hypothetical protein
MPGFDLYAPICSGNVLAAFVGDVPQGLSPGHVPK